MSVLLRHFALLAHVSHLAIEYRTILSHRMTSQLFGYHSPVSVIPAKAGIHFLAFGSPVPHTIAPPLPYCSPYILQNSEPSPDRYPSLREDLLL